MKMQERWTFPLSVLVMLSKKPEWWKIESKEIHRIFHRATLCTYHRPSPGGGPRANTTLYGDLYGGLNDHFTLHMGEMREVWFLKALQPGENRGLRKRNTAVGQFQVLFSSHLSWVILLSLYSQVYCGLMLFNMIPIWEGDFSTLLALCPLQGGGNQELRQDPVQSPLPCPGSPPRGWPMIGALYRDIIELCKKRS